MGVRELEYFLAVVDSGGVNRASPCTSRSRPWALTQGLAVCPGHYVWSQTSGAVVQRPGHLTIGRTGRFELFGAFVEFALLIR